MIWTLYYALIGIVVGLLVPTRLWQCWILDNDPEDFERPTLAEGCLSVVVCVVVWPIAVFVAADSLSRHL